MKKNIQNTSRKFERSDMMPSVSNEIITLIFSVRDFDSQS